MKLLNLALHDHIVIYIFVDFNAWKPCKDQNVYTYNIRQYSLPLVTQRNVLDDLQTILLLQLLNFARVIL